MLQEFFFDITVTGFHTPENDFLTRHYNNIIASPLVATVGTVTNIVNARDRRIHEIFCAHIVLYAIYNTVSVSRSSKCL